LSEHWSGKWFLSEVSVSINPMSTAKLGTHPLHPMLIPFPVAFLVGALVADLAFIGTGDGFWASASTWLIGAGIVMALLAAVAGFTDFLGEPRIRALNDAWYHMIGNLTAVLIAIINFLLRYNEGAEAAIRPWGVVLSIVVVAILTGWNGWEMVYSRGRSRCTGPNQFGTGHVAPRWRFRSACRLEKATAGWFKADGPTYGSAMARQGARK
jgi:uncharacterized membrane protein